MPIDQKQIPPEVVEAAFDAYLKDPCIDKAFFGKAIAAGLAAWPGVVNASLDGNGNRCVVLPLTEARDGE
jgi:hypothetical protein